MGTEKVCGSYCENLSGKGNENQCIARKGGELFRGAKCVNSAFFKSNSAWETDVLREEELRSMGVHLS